MLDAQSASLRQSKPKTGSLSGGAKNLSPIDSRTGDTESEISNEAPGTGSTISPPVSPFSPLVAASFRVSFVSSRTFLIGHRMADGPVAA